jgi:alanine dehydrogenase
MTLILRRQDVEELLNMEMAMEAVEQAFEDHGNRRTQMPDRPILDFAQYHGMLGVMPGYLERLGAAGVKVISHHENNHEIGLPESMGLIIYNDPATGMPLAIMDCAYITRMRTGAATGVSLKYLAKANARVMGIIGTGALANAQIEAVNHVCHLKRVKAYDINPDASANLKLQAADLGPEIQVVDSPLEACTDVDILVACTTARAPVVRADWVKAGMHIVSVGADMPHRRELSPGVYARADKWITDIPNQALVTGEVTDAIAQGVITEDFVHATLGEIVAGKRSGREDEAEVTIFKSTGMAIQDMATAKKVYELAKESDIGLEVAITP